MPQSGGILMLVTQDLYPPAPALGTAVSVAMGWSQLLPLCGVPVRVPTIAHHSPVVPASAHIRDKLIWQKLEFLYCHKNLGLNCQ